MAEPSVSVPQVSSEIPTSSETAPAEVATEYRKRVVQHLNLHRKQLLQRR